MRFGTHAATLTPRNRSLTARWVRPMDSLPFAIFSFLLQHFTTPTPALHRLFPDHVLGSATVLPKQECQSRNICKAVPPGRFRNHGGPYHMQGILYRVEQSWMREYNSALLRKIDDARSSSSYGRDPATYSAFLPHGHSNAHDRSRLLTTTQLEQIGTFDIYHLSTA